MSPALPKYEWLVVVPDAPGQLATRLEVRPEHFSAIQASIEAGTIKMGGAILHEPSAGTDASSLKFAGSSLVVLADSKQDVIDTLKKDIYARSGVWDMDKVQIWPLKTAIRKAFP